jgi:hypothetical protein
MSDWMAWAIAGGVIVLCCVLAAYVGGEHAPGDTVLRHAFKGRSGQDVETARGLAKGDDSFGGPGGIGPPG